MAHFGPRRLTFKNPFPLHPWFILSKVWSSATLAFPRIERKVFSSEILNPSLSPFSPPLYGPFFPFWLAFLRSRCTFTASRKLNRVNIICWSRTFRPKRTMFSIVILVPAEKKISKKSQRFWCWGEFISWDWKYLAVRPKFVKVEQNYKRNLLRLVQMFLVNFLFVF